MSIRNVKKQSLFIQLNNTETDFFKNSFFMLFLVSNTFQTVPNCSVELICQLTIMTNNKEEQFNIWNEKENVFQYQNTS